MIMWRASRRVGHRSIATSKCATCTNKVQICRSGSPVKRLDNAADHQLAVGVSTWVLGRALAELTRNTVVACSLISNGAPTLQYLLVKTIMGVFGMLRNNVLIPPSCRVL